VSTVQLAWPTLGGPIRASSLPPARDDDAELLGHLDASTEDEVFAVLVTRYQERVFRLALSLLGPGGELEAEDVAQEVFLQVHRKLHTFRSESRFSTWLYRIAYRKAVDASRRARHRHPHVGDDALAGEADPQPGADGLERTLAAERRAALARALATLPARHRSAVYLHYWLGLSVEEIARLLDASPNTVKSYLHRARARLAPLLSGGAFS
jgi:RNA polymerase sigma-70 factor (ECF subfamily)